MTRLWPHWLPLARPIVVFALGLILGCGALVFRSVAPVGHFVTQSAVAALVAVGAVRLGLAWLRRARTHIWITSHRVVLRQGLLGARLFDAALIQIVAIQIRSNRRQRLVRTGDILIESRGGTADLVLRNVRAPKRAQLDIEEAIKFNEQLIRDQFVAAAGGVAGAGHAVASNGDNASSASIASKVVDYTDRKLSFGDGEGDTVDLGVAGIPEQILQLDRLRQRGIVTDQEFRSKKRELLDRM